MSSFVPAGSLLMSAVARGRFGVLSSPRDAHSSQMESREGHGERPPLSPGAGTCTIRCQAGRGHLSSGWFGGEELRFQKQFSRTVCADGASCKLAARWHGRLQVAWEVLLQEHPLGMRTLS